MKAVSKDLALFLDSNQQWFKAHLYEIHAANAYSTQYYTSGDTNIVWNGNTYVGNSTLFNHSKISSSIGLEVDEVNIEIVPAPGDAFAGQPWKTAARIGLLDSAGLIIRTAVMPTWGDAPYGTVHRFQGTIADIEWDDTTIYATVRSFVELLDIQLPRRLYQPGCVHTHMDGQCGLSRASLEVSTSIDADYGPPTRTALPIAASNAAGYFELGTATFTSGANAGIRRTIKMHAVTHVINLAMPLPFVPADGDTCVLLPGCDKRQATCSGKFDNLNNFRGYPYIPVAETAT